MKKQTSLQESQTALRLKTLRVEYALTQSTVAEKLGVSQQTYSKYEKGEAAMDSIILRRICELYGVSADYILALDVTDRRSSDSEKDNIDEIVNKVLARIEKIKG